MRPVKLEQNGINTSCQDLFHVFSVPACSPQVEVGPLKTINVPRGKK